MHPGAWDYTDRFVCQGSKGNRNTVNHVKSLLPQHWRCSWFLDAFSFTGEPGKTNGGRGQDIANATGVVAGAPGGLISVKTGPVEYQGSCSRITL
jgi:hypothetical protein